MGILSGIFKARDKPENRTAVIGKLPDVRFRAGRAEDILHLAVCLILIEDAVFPDGIKQPVRFDPPPWGAC